MSILSKIIAKIFNKNKKQSPTFGGLTLMEIISDKVEEKKKRITNRINNDLIDNTTEKELGD
jgi:hypothetical protein